MATLQTNSNVLVAVRRETTTGTAALTTTGLASRIRIVGSPGLQLKRQPIQSQEKRGDGLTTLGRLGYKSVDGSHNGEVTIGGALDIMYEAILRSTWVTSFAVGFATMTTVALGSNTITAAGGDWINTQNLRVGDVFYVSGTTVSADNNLNYPIVAITTLTITTVTGAFTTLAATATGTLTIFKKVKNGSVPVRYSHTVEQYDEDIDVSELFLGCRLVGFKLSCKPGQMATFVATWMGMDRTVLTTGTSPWFVSPAITTGLGLIADDATIRKAGVAVATFTGFDLDFTIPAKGEPVIGSFVTPDIFDGDLLCKGSVTGLRSDFANLTSYDAETEFDVHLLLQENTTTAPKPCVGVYIPRAKFSALSAPVGGGDGAKVETLELMVGAKVAAAGYDATLATISSSAP